MRPLHRRLFLKTLAGAAAASSRAVVGSHAGIPDNFQQVVGSSPPITLEHGDQQLRVTNAEQAFGFQNYLRVSGKWKPTTLAGNSPVTGPSFRLFTTSVDRAGRAVNAKGSATAQGLDGQPLPYQWKSEIAAIDTVQEAPWFRFHTVLSLPSPLRLRQGARVEPQVIVWLHGVSTLMEGQSGSWRRVLLEQPTRNSLGAYGNDLPALYFLDQSEGVETMMYFDLSEANWMSLGNLPRFLVYRCSEVAVIEEDGNQRLGVGLIADQATGNVLPAGDVSFTYYWMQRPLDSLLSEQQATVRWMDALLPLFTECVDWPKCATSWAEVAAGTVEDLQNKGESQIEVGDYAGLLAYVKDSSKVWTQPPHNFELMAVADVLWPALLYLRLNPSPQFTRETQRLVRSIPRFYDPRTKTVSNSFSHPDANERVDSWYPFENGLIKFPMIGSLVSSKEIISDFLAAFASAQDLAHQYDYLFPIYYHIASRKAEGAGTNYAIGGLYAWGAILAHRLTHDAKYLEEARRAVTALCNVPADRLFHEPQELGFAALAAAELGMHQAASYLLSQQLRMFYWYSDSSQSSHDIRGMVQACASILYPAFKENVEAVLPWTGVLKRGLEWEGLLRFMDQQRRNNFFFFNACEAKPGSPGAKFIPIENLGTLELGSQTGNIGKEIYGSGEVLWLYLMFEGLGRATDRDLLLVNLDLLEVVNSGEFPQRELHFLLFNPMPEARTATITFPTAHGSEVRMTADGRDVKGSIKLEPHSKLRLTARF